MDSLIKTQQHNSSHHRPNRSKRNMMTVSDDTLMMKQIENTHSPDGREVEVKLLLNLVDDILSRATNHVDSHDLKGTTQHMENMEDKTKQAHVMNILDYVSYTIDRISCEISYKAMSGSDAHETTISVCHLLSSYHWDAKLVLVLAAFALSYGEFWLLSHIYTTNSLARSLAMLRLVPSSMDHSAALQSKFNALNFLVKAMMDVAKCVVDFRELPADYISQDVPELTTAISYIPVAIYWTIRSVVACAAQITMITTMGHEIAQSQSDSWELSTLADKLKSIYQHLSEKLRVCHGHIGEKKSVEALKMLHGLFRVTHIDNMKVLKALIYAKDDIQPLLDGSTGGRVHLEVLRRKNVLLLISGLDISQDEISILEHIYTESRQAQLAKPGRESLYEIVWIPIVDHSVEWHDTSSHKVKFDSLKATMPWLTVYDPKIIQKHVVEFIKEKWHFRNKPILVVLDPQGRETCPNAIHMMYIWGSRSFPFTSSREEALWKAETWRLDLLIDGIDQTILNWTKSEKYIFLYGGDDIEWIRRFTRAAQHTARDSNVPLEMVYVGKRRHSHRAQIKRIINTITLEKLSYCWPDPAMMWFFWTRLESMLFSKIQLNKVDEHDHVMEGIKKVLSYDRSGGWAVLSKGAEIIMTSHGSIASHFSDYETTWKIDVPLKGYSQALLEYYKTNSGEICSHFDFHVTAGSGMIPTGLKCPECNRGMEKYISFTCCHDDNPQDILEKQF